jgi:transposase
MRSRYVVEHLNHLGIVAEVCREIGVATWLDQQDPGSRQQVSVGTATVALVLNGLGFSNRQLYLVPQFFADKPVEHLLGPGLTAEALNDDCLGRTLDWLYTHDVTRLFAGLALRARRVFGVTVERLHADTTSFSVHGQYASPAAWDTETAEGAAAAPEDEPAVIDVTYGYSRDHREDLKQWMLALVTSGEGVPQFLHPLDGNASDKRALLEAVTALTHHLQDSGEQPGVYVADSGLYSTENMTQLNAAGVRWVSRVPETSTAALRPSSRSAWPRPIPGSIASTGRGTGGAVRSPIWSKASSAGSSCAVRTGRNERALPSRGKRIATRSAGRSACGIWETRRLPVSPTQRQHSPNCANVSRPGSWSRRA